MPNLILHIGPPKTGSTAVQAALAAQASELGNRGIAYYVRNRGWHWALMLPYRHPSQAEHLPLVLRKFFSTVQEALEHSEAEWARFEAWCKTEAPETVILSSEHLAFHGDVAGFVNRLANSFARIDVIGYARDPLESFASATEELIRTGWTFDKLPNPMTTGAAGLRSILQYEALVGRECLHVRPFSRKAMVGGDITSDFFSVLSVLTGQTFAAPATAADANPGVCGAAVAWFLSINQEQRINDRPPQHFKPFFAHRKKMVDRFRASETLATLPRLKVNDPVLAQVIRNNAHDLTGQMNARYLKPEHRFHNPPVIAERPGVAVVRQHMADWIQSYLTPDAMALLFAEIGVRSYPDVIPK